MLDLPAVPIWRSAEPAAPDDADHEPTIVGV
jgi:hypothetical protein